MATTIKSFAKINLGLAIGPVRADGFHGLSTIYQTLELHDLVTVAAERCGDGASGITITSNDARVPADGTNTCWKMVERWLQAAGVAAKVAIHIEKRLPVQGGLGAGSGNAVAAMIGLEAELGMRLPGGERLRIAEQVGSDVPLFVIGGTVLGLGRGEEVYPLPDLPVMDCVVAMPDVGVSTPQAFRDWDALWAPVEASAAQDAVPKVGPAMGLALKPRAEIQPALTNAAEFDRLRGLSRAWSAALAGTHSSGVFPERADLAENPLLALVHAGIENDFEQVVFPKYPLLREIKRLLAGSELNPERAALYAALSGSGSALFGLYRSEAAALAAVRRVESMGVTAYATKTRMRSSVDRD